MKPINAIKHLPLFLLFLSFGADAKSSTRLISGTAGSSIQAESVATFNRPWAMTFLPNGDLLVTEKQGDLIWYDLSKGTNAKKTKVQGVPSVAYAGQGGLGDIILHPQYQNNQQVYLSYAEKDASGKKGAVVIRATLRLPTANPTLEKPKVIWRQFPKTSGSGHYSHKMAFSPDGKLFITSGDRQKLEPAQDWQQNLGKTIRLNDDGTVPTDNPFQNKGDLAKTFWSVGHRNQLGISFDKQGTLWTHEMGPRHGDELNLTVKGDNYGWPEVSWGNHYSGFRIPNHDTRPEFNAPEAYWVPSIAPSGLIIYDGKVFPNWQGNAFIGGLRSQALIRVEIKNNNAKEAERFDMGRRIREVEQGPQGAIWLLEDGTDAGLLKLTPK